MSRPRPDTAFRPARPRSRDLSTPQLRALRKELLIVRAGVERAEMAASIIELRESVARFNWLRFLVPGLGRSRGRGLGAGLGNLLTQYPLLSSLVSLILAKPLRGRVFSAARPIIKWGALAFAAWEVWRTWQQARSEENQPARNESTETADDQGY
ncbi:DUF3318 domain-containing protein [Paraburkholderia dinghuensis]|uniref:DUF3318 domain-containing protein n=1 Tax=Paraburkholderia dinghuensis TaxID=2305225 RepID=A0A3N6P7C3_9BURK|nr:DUF3318 domain-containing protein [Paraburkholderia dinghuensis]RQH09943.1 DUF3318 domain-containing protein [Paraburkholderia dinghuensis]